MSTVLHKREQETDRRQSASAGVGFLEQSFAQLPAEGKTHLKNLLFDLVSLQDVMAGAFSADKPEPLPGRIKASQRV